MKKPLSWKQKKAFRRSVGYGFLFAAHLIRIMRWTADRIAVRDFSQLPLKNTTGGIIPVSYTHLVEVGCGSVLNPGTVIVRCCNIYPLSSVRGCVPANHIYKSKTEIAEKKSWKYRRGRLYEGYYFSHTACPFIFLCLFEIEDICCTWYYIWNKSFLRITRMVMCTG